MKLVTSESGLRPPNLTKKDLEAPGWYQPEAKCWVKVGLGGTSLLGSEGCSLLHQMGL